MDRLTAERIIDTGANHAWTELDNEQLDRNMMRLGRAMVEHGIESDSQSVTACEVMYRKQQRRKVKAIGRCDFDCKSLIIHRGKQVCRNTLNRCPQSNAEYLAAIELFGRLKNG